MSIHMPYDAPRIFQDRLTGTTTLSANNGSRLAGFLEDLARVWTEPQFVSASTQIKADDFRNTELTTLIEKDLLSQVWHAVADRLVMPLTAPTVEWAWMPQTPVNSTRPNAETVAKILKTQRPAPLLPGTELPTDGTVLCFVSVLTVPLARTDSTALAEASS